MAFIWIGLQGLPLLVKPLILDGFGFSVRTDSDNLVVQDKNRKAEVDFVDFRRRYNSVFICNRFGSISFHALNWLVQTDIPVYLLAPDGSINGIVTRNRAFVNGLFRLKQYEAFNDRERRKQIAEAFIAERIRQIKQAFKIEAKPDDESRLARKLFNSLKTEFESTGLSFGKRKSYGSSNLNIRAKSEVNALLNFGYSVLEGVCRKRLNFSVLDTSIGFLHNPARMKEPLVYDFQELGRTAVEKTILMLIRERQVGKKKSGFYRLEDMTVRLQPETVNSVSNALMQEFERIKFERFLNENIRNLVKSIERGNPFMISSTSLRQLL